MRLEKCRDLGLLTLWDLCGFSVKEESLCEAQICNENFVLGKEDFSRSIDSSYYAFVVTCIIAETEEIAIK